MIARMLVDVAESNSGFCMYLHAHRLPPGPFKRFKGDKLPVLVMHDLITPNTLPDAFPARLELTRARRVGHVFLDHEGQLVEDFGERFKFAVELLSLARAEHPFITWRCALTKGDRPTAYGVINGGQVVALVCAVQTWGQPMRPELLDTRSAPVLAS